MNNKSPITLISLENGEPFHLYAILQLHFYICTSNSPTHKTLIVATGVTIAGLKQIFCLYSDSSHCVQLKSQTKLGYLELSCNSLSTVSAFTRPLECACGRFLWITQLRIISHVTPITYNESWGHLNVVWPLKSFQFCYVYRKQFTEELVEKSTLPS